MVDHVNRSTAARLGRGLALALAISPAFAAPALAGPPTVELGVADPFALLAGSGATNTRVTTIDGDVGSSPTRRRPASSRAPRPTASR